jgi:hypothetical protein
MSRKTHTPPKKAAEVEPMSTYRCLRCPQEEGKVFETDSSKAFFDHLDAAHPGLVTRNEEGTRRVQGTKCLESVHLDGDTFYSWARTFGDSEGTPFLARSIVRPRAKNDPMRFR